LAAVLTACFLTLLALPAALLADEPAAVTLTANPGIILADGKSTTTIAAVATTQGGHAVPDGTAINFSTTAGSLSAQSVSTTGGIARVTLTSAPIAQRAMIAARFLTSGAGASGQITVEFTNDSAIANTDQRSEEWVQISSSDYLGYGGDSRIVDAFGKKQGAHFSYRGVTIDADAMQVDLGANIVRARKATIYHNRTTVTTADSLYYEYLTHSGTAVVENASKGGSLEAVRIIGVDLTVSILADDQAPAGDRYQFADTSGDHLNVTASSLSVKPGDKIQFRRAAVFVDGKKIIGLPIHIMPINTDQVFGQQVLGYGTDGMYLNMPYYIGATARTTDTFFVRSLSASRENGTFSTRPSPFSLDFEHSYKLASGDGDGSFQVLGIQRTGEAGLRWRHNHLIGHDTRTYLYIDRPNSSSIFSTATVNHQFKGFSANVSNSLSNSTSIFNSSFQERRLTAYVETAQRKLFGSEKTGVRLVTDLTTSTGTRTQKFNGQSVSTRTDTRGADMRFFTPAIQLTKRTTFSDSFNIGASRDDYANRSAVTMNSSLGLQTRVGATSSVNFSYEYRHDPLNQTFRIINNNITLQNLADVHTFGMSLYTAAPDNKWDFSLSSNIAAPTSDLSTFAALNFRVANAWRFGLTNTIGRTGGLFYKDYGLSLGRRIGQREIAVSWGAIDHRVRVNLDSARF
jgi:hypothetical protein